MCPVEYGVDIRVTTLFTILRLRRGERESAYARREVRGSDGEKMKNRGGRGEGDRDPALRDVPADVRLLRGAGGGRRFSGGGYVRERVEEDGPGASGGRRASLARGVCHELGEQAVHGVGHGSARGREPGHEHRGAARRGKRARKDVRDARRRRARIDTSGARGAEVRGAVDDSLSPREPSRGGGRNDEDVEHPRRARASHAPGAAVREFRPHALMHPLRVRLKRRKRQVAERVLHVGPRPRAAPDCRRWRKSGDLSHVPKRPFAASRSARAKRTTRSRLFYEYDARPINHTFIKTTFPYDGKRTRPHTRTNSHEKNPGRGDQVSDPVPAPPRAPSTR